ncbi:MAG: phosphatidylglycerol lysyltransferase domain-containing protein [Candidatus Omnitrophota bacterium]
MQIKTYPEFQPLEKEHKPLFDELFQKTPPVISEFTFTNLYSWRNVYKISISSLDGFILLLSEEDNKKSFFMPMGDGSVMNVMQKVLTKQNANFIRLPETVADFFKGDNRFTIELDRDNCDYLFKVEDLVLLKGKKYDGKRNLIKKFKSVYGYEYQKLDKTNIKQCLDFEERWCLVKDCDSIEGLNNERQAIQEMADNCSEFGLIAGAIRVLGKICALTIAERLNKDTMVLHILKADPDMIGLYQVMTNEFMARESAGFKYVNFEQDLGVPGLRKAKLSYNPIELIKKYTLTRLV